MYQITSDDYYNKNQPAKSEEIANFIEVYTQPLSLSDYQEIYRSKEPIVIGPNTTKTIDMIFEKQPAVEATAFVDETVSISIAYSQTSTWGARITLINNAGTQDTAIVFVTAKIYSVTGEELIIAKDEISIREFGIQKYTLTKNHLIQTREMAQKIADSLLSSYKNNRKDVELDWRGNPALDLVNKIRVPEYQKNGIDKQGQFYITKNVFNFDGTLRQQTNGRKLI